jgi:hypothetical protein
MYCSYKVQSLGTERGQQDDILKGFALRLSFLLPFQLRDFPFYFLYEVGIECRLFSELSLRRFLQIFLQLLVAGPICDRRYRSPRKVINT